MTDEEVLELFCKCHQEFPFPPADDIYTPISIDESFFISSGNDKFYSSLHYALKLRSNLFFFLR